MVEDFRKKKEFRHCAVMRTIRNKKPQEVATRRSEKKAATAAPEDKPENL
jgi:hypothetical protein